MCSSILGHRGDVSVSPNSFSFVVENTFCAKGCPQKVTSMCMRIGIDVEIFRIVPQLYVIQTRFCARFSQNIDTSTMFAAPTSTPVSLLLALIVLHGCAHAYSSSSSASSSADSEYSVINGLEFGVA